MAGKSACQTGEPIYHLRYAVAAFASLVSALGLAFLTCKRLVPTCIALRLRFVMKNGRYTTFPSGVAPFYAGTEVGMRSSVTGTMNLTPLVGSSFHLLTSSAKINGSCNRSLFSV